MIFFKCRLECVIDFQETTYEKTDLMSFKTKLQFEHELTLTSKVLEKELHTQRLEQLRGLSEKLKEDAWLYPDLEATLGL
ncbi:UNVERIFIED_CONTAM: hypothetical protein NCL1_23316 [Trichonephila clavipes]